MNIREKEVSAASNTLNLILGLCSVDARNPHRVFLLKRVAQLVVDGLKHLAISTHYGERRQKKRVEEAKRRAHWGRRTQRKHRI